MSDDKKKDERPIVPPLSEAQKEQARRDIEKEHEAGRGGVVPNPEENEQGDDGEGVVPNPE